ncbi:MAG: hypothetical protein FP816_00535 [Desulfobacteraceae bacterium]|nr:hypothetical protein [Desulfobacteraceae bacterium]
MQLISIFFSAVAMLFLCGCPSMFYASTQMPVQSKEDIEVINNPVSIKIERDSSMWGGAIPFVIYDGNKEIGRLGPSGAFEWKREAGYLQLKVSGAATAIAGPNLPDEALYEDYPSAGGTLRFLSGLNVDGKIAIWIKPQQERAPDDFVAFGRAERANTINAYGEFMKAYAKSSKVDEAIRRCDNLIEESGTLNINNLNNKNMDIIKAYLNARPEGKHAPFTEEVDQYYEAEKRPTTKAFEEYLQKYPAGQFDKWAKDNLAFTSLGEVTDQSLIKTQEAACRIAQSGFKRMLQYKKNSSNTMYQIQPTSKAQASATLPKGTDIMLQPASGVEFIQANNRFLMQLNALADIEGLVAQFKGTLHYEEGAQSSCTYVGTVSKKDIKDNFFLEFDGLTDRNIDDHAIPSGLLENSWIIMEGKQYYYNGRHWTHGLNTPFFHIYSDTM